MRDELLRRALEQMDKLNNNPGYRALMEHQEQLRRNPAHQILIEEANRRNQNPAHRALMENIAALDRNPGYRALIEFENNRRHYKEISALTQKDYFNDNMFRHMSDLRADISKSNAELWININVIQSELNFKRFEENIYPAAGVRLIGAPETSSAQLEKQLNTQSSEAAAAVEKINEDYSSIEKELSADERLAMFVVVGKNEYKIKSLVAEERSNRVKVFLDSGDDGLLVFFAPFELQVMFGKEKLVSAKHQKQVNFLSYKRGTEGKDEIRIISNRRKNNMKQLSIVRVVVASPGDVMPERKALEAAIDEINKGTARVYGTHLQLARWETDSYPGFHLNGAQGLIDPILAIEECDVFIGIFWKRFGTPTMNAQSGTEHEFLKAYDSWQKQGNPHIMFYFNQRPYAPSSFEEIQQWGQVLEFKKNFPKEGLWWDYDGEIEFEKLVRGHLTSFLIDYFSSADEEDKEDEISDESTESEPETLRDEEITIKANSNEFYNFPLNAGNTLDVSISSNEPLKIAVIDGEDVDAWSNNEEVDCYVFYENKKRISFNFEAEEEGEYVVAIFNDAFITDAEVDVKIELSE